MGPKFLFVSYSRHDVEAVRPIVEALKDQFEARGMNVRPWVDFDGLQPGQQWAEAISRALQDSIGLLVFVSPASMASNFVREELAATSEHPDRLIIPIVLYAVPDLPQALAQRQWIDLSKTPVSIVTKHSRPVREAVQKIVAATEAHLGSATAVPPVPAPKTLSLAATFAREARAQIPEAELDQKPPDSVFVVHGHDEAARKKVEDYLRELGIKPVVLKKIGGPSQSLFQKFLKFSKEARFAIVLLTGDDLGASCVQYDAKGVAAKALQFRARQNVILELGFFYGYLGWENVFVLIGKPKKVYPNFERPSDLDGVVFDAIDAAGKWRGVLRRKLIEAGFVIKAKSPRK